LKIKIPGIPSVPVLYPTDVWLRLSTGGAELLESELLGELLDRRSNTRGYAITQALKDLTSLKIANCLTEPPRALTTDAAAAIEFFRGILHALPHSTDRWYWFANPGVLPPPGAVVRHIDSVDGPDYSCSGGFNYCEMYGRDLRTVHTFEVEEGEIEVRSQTNAERFSPLLARVVEKLERLAPTDNVEIAFIRPRRKSSKGTWPTFERKRMAHRAQSIGRVATRRLQDEMRAHGFARDQSPENCGTTAWVRQVDGQPQYVVVNKWSFSSEIRIYLSIGLPFSAQSDGLPSAELISPSDEEKPFEYASQEGLEKAMSYAAEIILSAGMAWFANPMARTRREWKALGIQSRVCREEESTGPRVLPLP
jgi:hypothetical protein